MKPIFDTEKAFLEKYLKLKLPNNCWRDGSKIYLNHFDDKPIITFKVDILNDKINIKKENKIINKNFILYLKLSINYSIIY